MINWHKSAAAPWRQRQAPAGRRGRQGDLRDQLSAQPNTALPALADGTYAKYGLDVTIRPGGPQSNERALLTAGRQF
jgi:hypothetical protein